MRGPRNSARALICLLWLVSPVAQYAVAPQQPSLPAKPAPAVEPALRPFHEAVERYLALHRALRQELPSLQPNSDATQITGTMDALARAIQRARPKARQGDFFAGASSRAIKQRVLEVLRNPLFHDLLAGIDDETPAVRVPRIYLRYPDGDQLSTMPPSLLQALPRLPPELEYRLVGRYLVLRDTYAGMIVDFIADVTPRRP